MATVRFGLSPSRASGPSETMLPTRATDGPTPDPRTAPGAGDAAWESLDRRAQTGRRRFVRAVGAVGILGPTAGCLERLRTGAATAIRVRPVARLEDGFLPVRTVR